MVKNNWEKGEELGEAVGDLLLVPLMVPLMLVIGDVLMMEWEQLGSKQLPRKSEIVTNLAEMKELNIKYF